MSRMCLISCEVQYCSSVGWCFAGQSQYRVSVWPAHSFPSEHPGEHQETLCGGQTGLRSDSHETGLRQLTAGAWRYDTPHTRSNTADVTLDFIKPTALCLQVTGRWTASACLGSTSQILTRLAGWTRRSLRTAGEEKTGNYWTGRSILQETSLFYSTHLYNKI